MAARGTVTDGIIERHFADHAEAERYSQEHPRATFPMRSGDVWLVFESAVAA